jgi:glutamyl/glutaminyl-tRNA synthetase
LFARHHEGKFIFRSEDTDRARSKKEFEDEIIDGLHWLGLTYDAFSRQTENAERHKKLLEKIVGEGKAYISKEESVVEPGKIAEVIRLKNPGRSLTFHDEVHGDITFDTTELKDFVIARALDDPLYHFAVVADDWDSGVTHVIRGEDHIPNTPRQILIQEALGAPRPIYAHLPLILDDKRAKLSKRSGTAVSVMDYKDEGFLSEGLVNYLALLGWSPGDNREDFSLNELVELFTLEGIQKSGASWSREKLLSVNQRWMRKLSPEEFLARGNFNSSVLLAIPLIQERAHTFGEARALLEGELACLFTPPILNRDLLIAKGGDTGAFLNSLLELVGTISDHAPADEVKSQIMPYAEEKGRGVVLWPLRYALSGQERSPDPFTLISLLGARESIARIKNAIAIL